MNSLILGTAGHIDHGKTALIKALTGTDTDRLPEEKKRGITIELGFAELTLGDCRLGIVDVPGHERFVRNMLAGATGIDLALLVVAADDSVMPQTREHLEILRLLKLKHGVIAITKCDLPDPDWLELMEQEVRDLVADTFLADAPLVRTSAATGQGIDELRDELEKAAARAAETAGGVEGPFRMAVDRTFTIAGHGTVVTGSVTSGKANLGDELVIEPDEIKVRVRGLQNHGEDVDEVHRGQRAAIKLAGVHHEQLRRGHELATRGHLVPSRLLSVRLNLSEDVSRALKNRSRVRLHLGTAELTASVALLDRDRLSPGEWAPAQLFLSEPAVATWGQPFVVRSLSPVITIGGGQVIDPAAARLRRKQAGAIERLPDLCSEDPLVRASAAAYFANTRPWTAADLARTAGVDDPQSICRRLIERGDLIQLALSPTRSMLVHRQVLEDLADRVEAVLEKMHDKNPLRSMLDRTQLAGHFAYLGSEMLFGIVLERMVGTERIRLTDRTVGLAGRQAKLSTGQRKLLDSIIEEYRQAGFQPPSVDEIAAEASKNRAAVPQLVELAVSEGELVAVSKGLFLHVEAEKRLRDVLSEELSGGEGLTLSRIREILGTTRKYAVPICEYLDREGFTRREGDLRVLADGQ